MLSGCAASDVKRDAGLGARDVLAALEAERAVLVEGAASGAERFGELRARHPSDPYLRAREAELLHAAGERERAWDLLEAPEAPPSVELALARGSLAAAEARWEEARAHASEARRLAPESRRALVLALEIHLAEGDTAAATALADEVLAGEATLPFAVLRFRLDEAIGAVDASAARKVAARIGRDHPGRRDALLEQAVALAAEEPELALALLDELSDTFQVAGAKLAARDALRSLRRSR